MTITLHARPYDISAEGFYFRSAEEFDRNVTNARNSHGDPVEEFEIQFIDGASIHCELAEAIGINQENVGWFFASADAWDEQEKTVVILAIGECGYVFDSNTTPDDFDLDIYHVDSMRELAEQFVDEGMFGEIPERLQNYLDYDAIARDLAVDYTEAVIAGERLIYRCA